MTYDCISDCLGRDSILTPCSAGDGRIARVSDGEMEGFVAQMHRSLGYYISGRYGGSVCVCVCSSCVALLLDVLDGWLCGWMANYWVPQGIHLFASPFASRQCRSVAAVSQGRADMLLRGNFHQLWDPQVFPHQLRGIFPSARPWSTLGFLHRWPCPLHLQWEAHLLLDA